MNALQSSLSSILLVLAAAPASSGKTLEVSKGGKFPTIQSAVDAAQPGDTVRIESGTYRENVFVLASKTGIRIEGEGKVILDALPDGGAPAGPGLQVLAQSARIEDLIIRNARDGALKGHGLAGFGTGLRIEGVKVENCESTGIFLDVADGAKVKDCRIVACRVGVEVSGDDVLIEDVECERLSSSAILVEGNGARVKDCSVRNVGTFGVHVQGDGARAIGNDITGSADEGVFVEGDDARIEKNDFRTVLDFAVRVDGDRAKVKKNEVLRNFRTAFRLEGNDHVVVGNELVDVDGYGIDLDGGGARIESNEIAFTYGVGIDLQGGGFLIAKNEIDAALDGYDGVHVQLGFGGVIRDNEIRRVSGSAIHLGDQTSGITVEENSADECGLLTRPTFSIAGSNHLIVDNVAKRGGDDGFHVTGLGHALIDNRAAANLADGIDLQSGSLYEVRKNVAVKNGGEGIENSAGSVLIANNVAKKNRIDLANDSVVDVTFEKNEFQTGGKDTKPELE